MRRLIAIYRIIGAAMLAVSGIAGAYLLNASAKRGLEQTEALIAWLRFMRSEIECFAMPLPRALERCPRELYARCGYHLQTPPSGVAEFISACELADAETGRQLERFAEDIGKGYRDEQLTLCDYYLELLEARRQELCGQLPTRKKLNGALCLSGALALVILLI